MLKVKDQSAQAQPKKYYTAEEYLALEEKAEYKSEYYQGEIFGMAGATVNHDQIVGNVYAKMNFAFSKNPCKVFTNDIRVWIKSKNLFTYPDTTIVCEKPEFYKNRKDTIANPVLIVEVLSDSTESYDRGEKFMFYQSIPSLREYFMIDQHKIHVEQFSLGSDGKWVLTEHDDANAVLRCTSVKFQIRLREIYNKVEFENE
jgi:Uma2 family endonuclease